MSSPWENPDSPEALAERVRSTLLQARSIEDVKKLVAENEEHKEVVSEVAWELVDDEPHIGYAVGKVLNESTLQSRGLSVINNTTRYSEAEKKQWGI